MTRIKCVVLLALVLSIMGYPGSSPGQYTVNVTVDGSTLFLSPAVQKVRDHLQNISAVSKEEMARDIAALAPGGLKAAHADLIKFVEDLVESLSDKTLSADNTAWLAGDLEQALNPANGSVKQARIAVHDFVHGLKCMGVDHAKADSVEIDLRRLAPLWGVPDKPDVPAHKFRYTLAETPTYDKDVLVEDFESGIDIFNTWYTPYWSTGIVTEYDSQDKSSGKYGLTISNTGPITKASGMARWAKPPQNIEGCNALRLWIKPYGIDSTQGTVTIGFIDGSDEIWQLDIPDMLAGTEPYILQVRLADFQRVVRRNNGRIDLVNKDFAIWMMGTYKFTVDDVMFVHDPAVPEFNPDAPATTDSSQTGVYTAHAWQTFTHLDTWVEGKYIFCNNLWGGGKDCGMWADSHRRWAVLPNFPRDEMHVLGSPECWRGFHYSQESSPHSGFPIKLSELQKLKVRWAMREPQKGRHWALYDIYFAKEPFDWKGKGWCNVMLIQNWYDYSGWAPAGMGSQPRGNLGQMDAGGIKLWCNKGKAGWIAGPVITAIPSIPMPDAIFDLKELFLNLAKTGAVSTDWYLIGIEVAWEIHQLTEPLVTDYLEIDLNDENNLVTGPLDGWQLPPAVYPPPSHPQDPNYVTLPGNKPTRIDVGSDKDYTAADGTVWLADRGFTGGQTVNRGAITVAGTKEPALFSTERYGMSEYRFNITRGVYSVLLHLAETREGVTAAGQRVFDVDINGQKISGIDLFAEAKGARNALVKSTLLKITDGTLRIRFTASVLNAKLDALEIIPAWEQEPPATTTPVLPN